MPASGGDRPSMPVHPYRTNHRSQPAVVTGAYCLEFPCPQTTTQPPWCGSGPDVTIRRIPIEERLWARVDRSAGEQACWPWTGAKKQGGYGKIGKGGDEGWVLTHRVAWEMAHGRIPEGKVVCHTCDNPSCCNPGHLFIGTQADNLRDMRAKNRHCHGEAMTRALALGRRRRKRTHFPQRDERGRFANG